MALSRGLNFKVIRGQKMRGEGFDYKDKLEELEINHENIANQKHGLQYLWQDQNQVHDDAGRSCQKCPGGTD